MTEEGLPERRAGGDHVVALALFLDRADQVGRRVVVAFHPDLDDRAGRDLVGGSGGVDHDGGLEDRLELTDPGLVVALLGLGCVVIGVLADVTVLAGALDPL